jgi:hypothetical protein
MTFNIGDRVKKPTGYHFVGIVRAVFQTGTRETRYVVEHEVIEGLLHIFSEAQLMPRASFRPFNPDTFVAGDKISEGFPDTGKTTDSGSASVSSDSSSYSGEAG